MISNLSKWALQKFYKTIMNTNAPDIFLWFFQIAQRNLFWKVHRENEFLRKFSPMVRASDTGESTWCWWLCRRKSSRQPWNAVETGVKERSKTLQNAILAKIHYWSLNYRIPGWKFPYSVSCVNTQCSEELQNGGISAAVASPAPAN